MNKRRRDWQPSIQYGYVRTRQLEGTVDKGPRQGAYLLSAMRISAGWGLLNETRWPYNARIWPPPEPPGHADFDRIAGFNRIEGYFAIRTIEEAKACLAAAMPFQLTVRTTKDWRNPRAGVIPMTFSRNPGTFGENHCVAVVGYQDREQCFIFRNSWGASWGDGGYGYLPYSYMRHYLTECWAPVLSIASSMPARPGFNGVHLFQTVSPSGFPMVQTSIFDDTGMRLGWCFVSIRNAYLEVEEFFRSAQRAASYDSSQTRRRFDKSEKSNWAFNPCMAVSLRCGFNL